MPDDGPASDAAALRRSPFAVALAVLAALGLVVGASFVALHTRRGDGTAVATLLSQSQAQRSARVTATFSYPGRTQVVSGSIDFQDDRSDLVTTGTPRVETRSIGADTWVSGGMPLPAGKTWWHLAARPGRSGMALQPTDVLRTLAKEGGKAKKEGTTTLRGLRVRRYVVTGVFGGSKGTVEVYLDDDGLLRRIVQRGELSSGKTLSLQLDVLEYTDGPVVVEAPPADQVIDDADLRQALIDQARVGP